MKILIISIILIFIFSISQDTNDKFAKDTLPDGKVVLYFYGAIEDSDVLYFKKQLWKVKPSVIVLNSLGGSIEAGLKMAQEIRLYKTITVVNNRCYSSCAIMAAAGSPTVILNEGTIGLHTPYHKDKDDNIIEDKKYSDNYWDLKGSLVASLKDDKFVDRWMRGAYNTHSTDMFIISADTAEYYGITAYLDEELEF